MNHVTHDRRRVRATGVVQGVGFRPFVHRLASELTLAGFVGNDTAGLLAELEGESADLDRFVHRLLHDAPPLARIESIVIDDIATCDEHGFRIVASSAADGPRTLVPPDVATCDACLAEIREPRDRRYRYPFTNCTDCGPRFTIIRDLPYDRPATSMAGFAMCEACAAEYSDPDDRRYHAQPIACPACGPQLSFVSSTTTVLGNDPVLEAVQRALAAGRIVAIKGLGGYHLACDATNDEAVRLLRRRKGRGDKPFAVMVADPASLALLAEADDSETAALCDPARPIVILRRRDRALVSESVAPGNPWVGVMLPYSPLHHLLFDRVPGSSTEPPRVLVLTSGNRADEPICFDDTDARERLADLADAFCGHDRPIEVPCDDSVVRVVAGDVVPIRRSRGYAPLPIALSVDVAPVVGAGGELKTACCVASGRRAWMGQHVGDMGHLESLEAFAASVGAFTRMFDVTPIAIGADRHPGFATRHWALEQDAGAVVDVQHHHAHVASLMAEHGLAGNEPVLGVAFDGTGYGVSDDGEVQIWGGEFLLADYSGYRRVAHLAPLPLPGGDAGVRSPCRTAVAYLTALGVPLDPGIASVAACDAIELGVIARQVERNVGCVSTTSMGRLFDVAASLLGVRHRVEYEAQAAIELEGVAERGRNGNAAWSFGWSEGVLDPTPVLLGLIDGMRCGAPVADLARAFHVAVAGAIERVARSVAWPDGVTPRVGLTGGVFQNALLTELTVDRFRRLGMDVLTHRVVPPNDGGLSLGQAVIAGVAAASRGA